MAISIPRPAHSTKHIPILDHPFQSHTFKLSQKSDGANNGTALWLGGQCLALYLASIHDRFASRSSHRPSAVELGSGIGLTALALSTLGWDVLATDIPHVIDGVLSHNIRTNVESGAFPRDAGQIHVRELDWTVDPESWSWSDLKSITSQTSLEVDPTGPRPPFDLILTADTVYSRELVTPLLRTIHALSLASSCVSNEFPKRPTVFLCLERRDPVLVDSLINEAKEVWGFAVERIPQAKLAKCIQGKGKSKNGTVGGWAKSEWEGVEIWKLRLKPQTDTG